MLQEKTLVLGIVDEIIPEVKGGAHKDVKAQAEEMDATRLEFHSAS